MKIAVMQPYFLPYIGYWQLMHEVDTYVILDDVNYIKRGWIHRNRILFDGMPRYLNLPIKKPSQNKLINETEVNLEELSKKRMLAILKQAYRNAPYFDEVFPIACEIADFKESQVSSFISKSFDLLCPYLGIKTKRLMSSSIDKDTELKGEHKIIDICERLGGQIYINAIGGIELYHDEAFRQHEIELKFLKSNEIRYEQFDNNFVESLSIIDVMMFNSQEECRELLREYRAVPASFFQA